MLKLIFISDKEIIARIRKNDRTVLGLLYQKNKTMIMRSFTKLGANADEIEDLLQEAIVLFWKNVTSGKYVQQAKISSYLFAIAKNKWKNEQRRKQRMKANGGEIGQSSHMHQEIEQLEQKKQLQHGLNKLGDPCKQLFLLFYWEERSIKEIAQIMGFANADVVKAKKYQCKKRFQKILSKIMVDK